MADSKLLQLKSIKQARKNASSDDQYLGDPQNDKAMRKLTLGIDGNNDVQLFDFKKENKQGGVKPTEIAVGKFRVPVKEDEDEKALANQDENSELKSLDTLDAILKMVDHIDKDSEAGRVDWDSVHQHLEQVYSLMSAYDDDKEDDEDEDDKSVSESVQNKFFF